MCIRDRGNNNGAVTEALTNLSNNNTIRHLGRTWQAQEVGEVGNVNIQFDLSDLTVSGTETDDFTLIIDSDTNFSAGAATTSATTYDSDTNTVTFSNIDLADGDYFTLGTEISTRSPGGISDDLLVWLKADAGIQLDTEILNEGGVEGWLDQSGNDNDFTQDAHFSTPTTDGEALNFNPAIIFDGINDQLEDDDAEDYLEDLTAISSFVVVDSATTSQDRYIFSTSQSAVDQEAPWSLRFDEVGTLRTGLNLSLIHI